MGEWGLQAIIRPHLDDDHFGSIDDMIKQEYDHQALHVFCYPHLLHDLATNDDELNQLLYKPPFYNNNNNPPVSAANNNIQTSDQEFIQQDQEINHIANSNASQLAPPKLKKSRKNQQKRVVVQVTAAGLSSDPWAWRKYGQKPIKGSIYPRSYYRCSSSKGCMARRQVEQSCSDSSIYILTYTADHNHPQPTRRNSLAGINRKPTPNHKTLTQPPFHSPSLLTTINEDDHQQSNIKQLETATLYNKCDINDEDFMVFTDDFFEGLEDLGAGYYNNKIMESSSSSSANYNYSSTKHYVS